MGTAKMTNIEYRKPFKTFIGSEARKLYRLEEKRNKLIIDTATELMNVLGFTELWKEAIPQTLYDTLESFDQEAAKLAAIAFLESRGYDVSVACKVLKTTQEILDRETKIRKDSRDKKNPLMANVETQNC